MSGAGHGRGRRAEGRAGAVHAIGSVQPFTTVAVRALVAGQLTRVWFREGEDVSAGSALHIDPRPYQAALAQAQANLARDEAQLRNAESEAARYAELVKKDYVTREEYDKFVRPPRRRAPSSRRIAPPSRTRSCSSRTARSARRSTAAPAPSWSSGNLVKANDTTPLVIINQVQPVYVQFAVPSAALRELRADRRQQRAGPALQQGGAPARRRTADLRRQRRRPDHRHDRPEGDVRQRRPRALAGPVRRMSP